MISYKVLMTLTVIFIISSNAGNAEDDKKVKNCVASLTDYGLSNLYGFLNFCIIRQFGDINAYMDSLESKGIAFVNYSPELREMTEKEVIFTKFFNDNFDMNSRNKIQTPKEYCRANNVSRRRFGCLPSLFGTYTKCENEITKKYENLKTVRLASNEDGVEWPETEYSTFQTFMKENIYRNVIVVYNLTYVQYSESTHTLIDETMNLWPVTKLGYFNAVSEEFKIQNRSDAYWTKTKWCMKYYNQKPIQDSTSGTNPPLS